MLQTVLDILTPLTLLILALVTFYSVWCIWNHFTFMQMQFDQLRKEISKLDEAVFEINNRNSTGSSDGRKTMSSDKNSENSNEGSHKCMQ